MDITDTEIGPGSVADGMNAAEDKKPEYIAGEKLRIGIFGGTFNPVHKEHVNVVRAAKSFLGLHSVIVVPTAQTPGKRPPEGVTDADRLEMCRLAFPEPGITVSSYEINKGGISYTYRMCRHFKDMCPYADIYLIVGADRLESFGTWSHPEEILKYAKVAACAREHDTSFAKAVESFRDMYGQDSLVTFPYTGFKISSTRCRILAGAGEDVRVYVPADVADYIRSHGLYYNKTWADVKDFIDAERWKHSIRVAYMAAENCDMIRWDEQDAVTAGILHDCAKTLDLSSKYLKGFVPPPDVPKPVMHQYTGAYLAEHYFGVKDEKILSAIGCHCSGKPDMSKEDMLIFLCDLLEEGRDFPEIEIPRAKMKEDIALCTCMVLEHQINHLQSGAREIYPLTQEAFDSMKEKYHYTG